VGDHCLRLRMATLGKIDGDFQSQTVCEDYLFVRSQTAVLPRPIAAIGSNLELLYYLPLPLACETEERIVLTPVAFWLPSDNVFSRLIVPKASAVATQRNNTKM
jgi:hypothetical protein